VPLVDGGPRRAVRKQRGQRLLGRLQIAREPRQTLQGGGVQLTAGEQAAVQGPGDVRSEPLGGPAVHGPRRTALQGPLEQAEIARFRPRPDDHPEVEPAGLVEAAVAAQAVRLQQVAMERGEEGLLLAEARRRVALEVAALNEGIGHPFPGRRIVRQHGEGFTPVGGRVEPGIEQAAEIVGILEELRQQAARDLPFARRESLPGLEVRGGEEADRLPLGGREPQGGLERLLPLPVGGEQPRVPRLRPAEIGGRALNPGGLPRSGAPGQDLAARPGGRGHPFRALSRRPCGGNPLMPGGIELGGEHGARGPQPYGFRVGLAAERRGVQGDALARQPAEHLLPRRLQGAKFRGHGEAQRHARRGEARASEGSGPTAAGG